MLKDYIPIAIQMAIALGFAGFVLLVTHILGPKRFDKRKLDTYECGLPYKGDSRTRFSIKFYLIAVIFVIFDIEVVFLYPWAVNFKKLGLFGFIEMMIFIAVLLVGLVYVWKKGALEWE